MEMWEKRKYFLKLGLKHSSYSAVMHSLCTQDTKSTSLPMTSFCFLAQNTFECQNAQPTKQQTENLGVFLKVLPVQYVPAVDYI